MLDRIPLARGQGRVRDYRETMLQKGSYATSKTVYHQAALHQALVMQTADFVEAAASRPLRKDLVNEALSH